MAKFYKKVKREKLPEQEPAPVLAPRGKAAEALGLPFINDTDTEDLSGQVVINSDDFDFDNLGSNFQVLDNQIHKQTRKVQKRTKFTVGQSRFLFFIMKPPRRSKPMKKRKPINVNSKLTEKDKVEWKNALVKNIQKTSKFLEQQVLPFTAALSTAILDSEERFGQLIDDPQAKLPKAFMLKKASQAAQLMMIDHIASVLKLSTENRKIMKVEYFKGLHEVPPSQKPTEVYPNGNRTTSKEKEG